MKLSASVGYGFTKAITYLIGTHVSYKRVESYLLKEDLKKKNEFKKADKKFIKVTDLTTIWSKV